MKPNIPYTPSLLPLDGIDYNIFHRELTKATQAITKYSAALQSTKIDTDLLLTPLLRREAMYSTRIEGTQSTLEDIYQEEALENSSKNNDINEVLNYLKALIYAERYINDAPITTRLFHQIHTILLTNAKRSSTSILGEFRSSEVYIGGGKERMYTPPIASQINDLISNLEKYINDNETDDPLVKTAIIHAQFESIHPYRDGNGRVGRVLIPVCLYKFGIIPGVHFFLSKTLEEERYRYYDLLNGTRSDNIEGWINWIVFFLNKIEKQGKEESALLKRIEELYDRVLLQCKTFTSPKSISIIKAIFKTPIFTIRKLYEATNINEVTIRNNVKKLMEAKIVYSDNRSRNKNYYFYALLDVLKS